MVITFDIYVSKIPYKRIITHNISNELTSIYESHTQFLSVKCK